LSATFLAILGIDLIILLFPDEIDESAAGILLITLIVYLSLECLGFCIYVKGYLFSWFFVLDIISILAVFVEGISSELTSDPYSYWSFLHIQSFHHLPLLRTGRAARYSVRLGRLSTLRANKVFVLTRHPASDDHHGITHFGRKAYDDEQNLYPYMKEKFIDAFREQENNGYVSRDDFTMMVRNLLHLDLEPEEEEVLYRIVTVFGRSQDIKFMEDQLINTDESSPKAGGGQHWATLRSTPTDQTTPFKRRRKSVVSDMQRNKNPEVTTSIIDESQGRMH
jgi:hypothetical protein